MSTLRRESMDDFDNFIRHSDFGKILELASSLKDQKAKLVTLANAQQEMHHDSAPSLSMRSRKKKKFAPTTGHQMHQTAFGTGRDDRPQSRMVDNQRHPSSFDSAAELIRTTLIPSTNEGSDPMVGMMGRGECLEIDSLIDETIKSLAEELKMCLDLKKQLRAPSRQESRVAGASSFGGDQGLDYGVAKQGTWTDMGTKAKTDGSVKEDDDGKFNPITKFSKWQTDILTVWMIENREHPFPTQDQIRALATAANLNDTQITNWVTNVRKRNLKATVDGEKKPHHFLDYLFLATDREKKMKQEHPKMDFSFLDNTMDSLTQRTQTLQHGQDSVEDHSRRLSNASQPSTSGYAPPRLNHHRHQQPGTHQRHNVAPPPQNTNQIFRRGKQLKNLKQQALSAKAEWSTDARESERIMLQKYAPRGIDMTPPPGIFDENDGNDLLPFDHDVFGDQEGIPSLPKYEPVEDYERKTVSFEMGDVPYDESEYLMRLINKI